jgi:hypothetical protein
MCLSFRLPLTIGGEKHVMQVDVGIMGYPTPFTLMVVEDKITTNPTNGQAQVVAEAITTFQYNNQVCQGLGFNPWNAMMIPCVVMKGT